MKKNVHIATRISLYIIFVITLFGCASSPHNEMLGDFNLPSVPFPPTDSDIEKYCTHQQELSLFLNERFKNSNSAEYKIYIDNIKYINNNQYNNCKNYHNSPASKNYRKKDSQIEFDNNIQLYRDAMNVSKYKNVDAETLIGILLRYKNDEDKHKILANISERLSTICTRELTFNRTIPESRKVISTYGAATSHNDCNLLVKQEKAKIDSNESTIKVMLAQLSSKSIDRVDILQFKNIFLTDEVFAADNLKQEHYNSILGSKRTDISIFLISKNLLFNNEYRGPLYEHVRRNGSFDELFTLVELGDSDSRIRAKNVASTLEQRDKIRLFELQPDNLRKLTDSELNTAYKEAAANDKLAIEKIVVPRFAQRLANIKYTVANARTQAYGGNDTSLGSQLMALLGSKVGVSADTPVTYSVQLNPALLKVQGNYNFKGQIVLKATGKETWQTHCMWPLPKVCDNENNAAVKTYTKNISGTVSGNTIHTGSVYIEWKPKFANRSMGGLVTSFVTNDVSVSLVGFTIEAQN